MSRIQPRTRLEVVRGNHTTGIIEAEIQRRGAIPYSDFMRLSLYGPDGFYSRGKVGIGEDRDFETSPERSDLFGLSLAGSIERIWSAMGCPAVFRIIEMGAGEGAMADSILHWTREVSPEFHQALRYTILEYGDLICRQKRRIQEIGKVEWVQGSATLLPFRGVEGVFLSNELPDAFPVERVARVSGEMRQRYVGIQNNRWIEFWGEPSAAVLAHIAEYGLAIREGVEEPINLEAARFQEQLCAALRRGAILTIDYGRNGEVGVAGKAAVRCYGQDREDPVGNFFFPSEIEAQYRCPGSIDITSDVNFKPLEEIARRRGLEVAFSGPQSDYLTRSGIVQLAGILAMLMVRTRSWRDAVAISRSLQAYPSLLGKGLGDCHCLLLLKGLDTSSLIDAPGAAAGQAEEMGRPPSEPPIRLKLGQPGEVVYLDMDAGKREQCRLDEDGRFSSGHTRWSLHQLMEGCGGSPAAFYRGDGSLVLDSSDSSQLRAVVEASGYRFDPGSG